MGGVLCRVPGALWLSASDTIVALSPDGDEPAVITGSGAGVWEAFARPTRVETAITDLARQYGVGADEIRTDVESAVEALLKLGLIEEVG
jgi:hypothetical protein